MSAVNIAIIPCKGTSSRLPGKNIREFFGKPMVSYAVETARKSGLFDRVFISTRDPGVIEVAKSIGCPIIMRPFELSEINHPDCGTHEVTRHGIHAFKKSTGHDVEIAACIYPCSPLMTVGDLAQAWKALYRPGAWWAYGVGPDGKDSGTFYLGPYEAWWDRLPMKPDSPHVWPIQIPVERCCDINTPEDWDRAEQLYKAMKEAEDGHEGAVGG